MQLKARDVRQPAERRDIVDHDVANVGSAFTPRHRRCLDPVGRVSRRVFLVEEVAVHAIRVALQRHRAIAKMRQQERGDADVVVDHLRLCEPARGIQNLVRIGDDELRRASGAFRGHAQVNRARPAASRIDASTRCGILQP
jgi:hypothetical protein